MLVASYAFLLALTHSGKKTPIARINRRAGKVFQFPGHLSIVLHSYHVAFHLNGLEKQTSDGYVTQSQ